MNAVWTDRDRGNMNSMEIQTRVDDCICEEEED